VTDAASQVTYEPLIQDGKPSEFEMTISYSFDSDGKPARAKDVGGSKGRIVDAGALQGRVKFLARPAYPAGARANPVSGAVPISVLVDFDGKVDAACRSSIEPVQLSGTPIKVSGVITFTFVA